MFTGDGYPEFARTGFTVTGPGITDAVVEHAPGAGFELTLKYAEST